MHYLHNRVFATTMSLQEVPGTTWFLTEEVRDDAPIRLFCFPSNAGLATEFRGWSASLDAENVECYCVQAPGKGSRRYEAALEDANAIVHSLVTDLIKCMDKPFAFFGHELGSELCIALTLELQARGLPQPRRLMVESPLVNSQTSVIDESTITEASRDVLAMVDRLRAFMETKSAAGCTLSCPVSCLRLEGDAGDDAIAAEIKIWHGLVNMQLNAANFLEFSAGKEQRGMLKAIDRILSDDANTSRAESVLLVEKWNSATQEYPDSMCLHDMFRESAAKNRDATAILYKDKSLTFGEVDDLTDALAGWLYAHGVRVGTAVGIFMDHRTEYALAYIAAHKATGAYMPLELVYPQDMLEGVLKEVKPPVVLTEGSVAGRLPEWQVSLTMDEDGAWIDTVRKTSAVPSDAKLPTPDDLAYVVMSSGTTGAPKGICCPHRGAVHSYYHRLVNFPYQQGDREACHVFFVWEMLRPLLGGMKSAGEHAVPLYVIPDDHIYDPPRLLKFLGDNAITRMLFTPSLLQLVLDQSDPEVLQEGMKSMRIVWLCGEVVTVDLRNKFKTLVPHCHMENLYSISECHDISFANLDELDTSESPMFAPCGKVVPNVRAYILNDQLQQVPVGVPGRMWIAGPTLAIGYLNMPEKTAERFVQDPFAAAAGSTGERMYDTGDRCRYLPSGSIEVISRCDYMVKVRGYSVVIGAVEAAITEHPLVSTSVVLTEGTEGSMDKKLVAYIVPASWDKLPSVTSLQMFLKSRLPPYAVPHVCILLDAVPLNMASGKADRKRLPKSSDAKVRFAPVGRKQHEQDTAYQVAADLDDEWARAAGEDNPLSTGLTQTQRLVARQWARLLKVPESTMQPSSDFFDLGGHSLLLAKLSASLLKDAGVAISISSIVENPTLGELATVIIREMILTRTGAAVVGGVLLRPAQRAIAQAWAAVLDPGIADTLQTTSDFFEMGGHSLLLAKLVSAIAEETGVTVTIPEVLENPTLGGMARIVEDSDTKLRDPVPTVFAGLRNERALSNSNTLGREDAKMSVVLQHAVGDLTASTGDFSTSAASSSVAEVMRGTVDLEAEAMRLDSSIYPARTRKVGYARTRKSVVPPQRVFLTGASGFFGAHILASLLADTAVDVFCLIRAASKDEGFARLEKSLNRYNLLNEDVELAMDRVYPVQGDLSLPLFGLEDSSFKMLAAEVDAIIHSGASVNLLRSYESLKPVNVLGTQEVLRLSVTNAFGTRARPVHFVSTNGVFPFVSGSEGTKTFMETADMKHKWLDLRDGYGQSKWVAERMCHEAGSRGVPVSVLRPGNLSPSSRTGAWNKFDFIYMLLQGCLELGCVPEGVAWKLDLTPVDFAARAVVQVTVHQPQKALGKVLHVQNPGEMRKFDDVTQWLRETSGVPLEGVPLEEFRQRISQAVVDKERTSGVLPQLHAGLDSFSYYITDPGHLDCAEMQSALSDTGVECPILNETLIGTYASTLACSRE